MVHTEWILGAIYDAVAYYDYLILAVVLFAALGSAQAAVFRVMQGNTICYLEIWCNLIERACQKENNLVGFPPFH
ncbi:hypothetical protein ACS2QC_29395, partial [Bacillus cereus group sp. Bce033]|uniref:hypothetical protein n=1 Tax=Bacillus cereus group sp. Bce033 TaxID=3445235 RepID=UPI003F2136C4